jgi:hypothetical protein
MDGLETLFRAYDFVVLNNPKVRSAVSWIFVDGDKVYAVICGRGARFTSNAIYHALRAAGRRGVRRVANGRCWVVSYI